MRIKQIQGGDDAPTCSTGNAAFSPGAKLPEEAGCWEAVVVGGVSVDGVLVAHAWVGLLEEELERESKGLWNSLILRKQTRLSFPGVPGSRAARWWARGTSGSPGVPFSRR